MGKYDHIITALPRLAGEEPDYQAKVDAVKEAIVNETGFQRRASTLADKYVKIRLEKDALNELLFECNLRLTAIEQLLINQYEVESTNSLRLESGESVSIQLEPYAQVQNREVYRQWCIEQGLENLMSLPGATTNKLVKDRLLAGEPEPPGVRAFIKSKIVLRRG